MTTTPDKPTLNPTDRTRLRRAHQRGHFDRDTINAILDATPLCHVGMVHADAPVVVPTFQWREGERVYWHGSTASRAMRTADEASVCLTVALMDGMVLARSAFHHSVNFRSVMVFGTPEAVSDPAEKEARLRTFIEALYPGRWEQLRPITARELKATSVLSLPLNEASAKIRTGGPIDDEEDYDHPVWAGVLPLAITPGTPEPDARNLPGLDLPGCVRDFRLG